MQPLALHYLKYKVLSLLELKNGDPLNIHDQRLVNRF